MSVEREWATFSLVSVYSLMRIFTRILIIILSAIYNNNVENTTTSQSIVVTVSQGQGDRLWADPNLQSPLSFWDQA